MMKKLSTLVISSLGLVALASGCAVDAVESEELLGTEDLEAQVCSNDQATNAIIAALAVMAGKEAGTWDSRVLFSSDGYKLSLTQAAKDRCTARGKVKDGVQCPVMSSFLLMQTGGNGLQYGGAQLTDPNVLRSRLMSYYNDQVNCYADTARNGDSQPQNCPRESHDLSHYNTTQSQMTCVGGRDFWFKGTYAGTSTPLSGTDAAQLKNALKWAGGNQNPYLAFEMDANVVGDVKIDPIDGGTGDGSSGTGACDAALNPVWVNNAWKCDNTTDSLKLNQCCTCNGQQRSWKTAILSGQFACKL